MKTSFNLAKSSITNLSKQFLYALQVIIIALAIPVLAYLELSHRDNKTEETSSKNTIKITTVKSDGTAFSRHLLISI